MPLLGIYVIGNRKVAVHWNLNGSNGWFDSIDSVMHIGIKHEWPRCLSTLIHEAMEQVMLDSRLRWSPDIDYGQAADQFLFVMNHAQFSEACAEVGYFLAVCAPDLLVAWKKTRKPKPKSKRKGRK